MSTETFRAQTVTAALEEVQRKLGPNAMIVSVRQVPPEQVWQVWRSPEIEVVAMAANASPAPAAAQLAQPMPQPNVGAGLPPTSLQPTPSNIRAAAEPFAPAAAKLKPSAAQKALLEQLMEQAEKQAAQSFPPVLQEVSKQLLAQGVDEILVKKLTRTCTETLSKRLLEDKQRLTDHLSIQLNAGLRSRPETALASDRVVCLIGQSGVGKTSTCAKLAASCLQSASWRGRKLVWICADTFRPGAVAEARQYTDALGIPLEVAYTPQELDEIVKDKADADLILVDTSACNPYKESSVITLGDFLTALPNRATYLVASATGKDNDLSKSISIFKPFNLKSLIITHLDETNTYGNVYNFAWRSQISMMYFSSGARIPTDLAPAQTKRLVSALFGEGWAR